MFEMPRGIWTHVDLEKHQEKTEVHADFKIDGKMFAAQLLTQQDIL